MSFFLLIIVVISRSLDIFPLKTKFRICKLFPERICNSIIRNGFSRKIKWKTKFGSYHLKLSPGDDFFGMYILGTLENWEQQTLDYWRLHSRNVNTVIDVGSYIGAYSLIAASGQGATTVLAFEPNRQGFDATVRNGILNSLNSQIKTSPLALGSVDKNRLLIAPKGRSFSSSVALLNELETLNSDWEVVDQVLCKRLDSILDSAKIESIALIKIDTEGNELDVLVGAVEILRRYHPKLIVECLTQGVYQEIENFLEEFQYNKGIALDGCHLNCAEFSCAIKARNYAFE